MASIIRALKPRLPFYLPAATGAASQAGPSTSASSPQPSTSATPTTPLPTEAVSEPAVGSTEWSPYTKRTGLIARKRGMASMYDANGKKWPVTILQLDSCQVVRHRGPEPNSPNFHNLQIGSSNRPIHTTKRTLLGHFVAAGVAPKYRLTEFQVTPDAVLPVGTELNAAHFVPGQYVDVSSVAIGKGFQGAMKRWGFRGQSASHGTTKTHRSVGSTGQNTSPGRVFPGKKMPGRMGGKQRTTQNLLVHRIDTELNLMFVRGPVPGPDDQYVKVRDAIKKVGWRAQNAFKAGLPMEEWLQEGVLRLPMPGGTKELVQEHKMPAVVEWQAEPKTSL